METVWRFHHETWDEPWSSNDFPAGESKEEIKQRLRRLTSEAWWENTNSEVVEFLHDELPFQWPWGFTIYRTVYTSESDQYWDTVLEAISKIAMERLDEDEPSRIFQEGYRPLVFDDPAQFNEATLDKIRDHFREVQESDNGNDGVRFRWCLVIDDGALQSILRHPEPESGQEGGWVTVVDPSYQGGSSYNTRYYPGYFRLYLGYLWSLVGIGSALELDDLCGRMDGPDDIPWFDPDITGQGVGSLTLVDVIIANTPTGIITSLYQDNSTAFLLQNVGFFNVQQAIVAETITEPLLADGNEVLVDSWGFGMYANPSGTFFAQQSDLATMERKAALVGSNTYVKPNIFTRRRPQYYDLQGSQVFDVRSYGAKGDGNTDDTVVLNSILGVAANLSAIVYFPYGIYVIQDTLNIPQNSRIIGRAWPQIMAKGSKFQDVNAPHVAVRVGSPGDVGIVEIQDMLFTVSGTTAGNDSHGVEHS
ncbi:hypothetical protein TCE0_004r00154 [Talaromyces pinophilus]|uniref:Rhamnogalacturonase A/B/Epimerase-like pectate lyase domain-containing protein n=1 Tax=Talaromyces pinophilus TaxID=128442 RepID=A0A0B8N397_TALPI|nr:hypothetical protein TCE0_004r00154 [Talaromyces pinophilus]